MNLNGRQLTALYGHGCRTATRLKINDKLEKIISAKIKDKEAISILKELICYNWQSLLAKTNKIKNPLSKEISRAFWTGNKFTKTSKIGTKKMWLFHNFIVLLSDSFDQRQKDNCKVSLGEVVKSSHNSITVMYQALKETKNQVALILKERKIERGFLEEEIKTGDLITFHEGSGREKLNKAQAESLRKKTEQAVKLFNQINVGS